VKACEYSCVTSKNRAAYKVARRTRLRDRAILVLLYDTGMRSSELCTVRFRDLDMENRRIHVTGKGRKQRHVFFGKAAARDLWKYHASRYPKDRPRPDDYLFLDQNNLRPMNRGSVLQLVVGLGNSAEVVNAHPHRLRHTFAINFLKNGGNVFQLQDILGHASLKMCKRYARFATNDLQDAHGRASPYDRLLIR
jgi:integrase/recombinase XerD